MDVAGFVSSSEDDPTPPIQHLAPELTPTWQEYLFLHRCNTSPAAREMTGHCCGGQEALPHFKNHQISASFVHEGRCTQPLKQTSPTWCLSVAGAGESCRPKQLEGTRMVNVTALLKLQKLHHSWGAA